MKSKKKSLKQKLVNFKVTARQFAEIKKQAKQKAGGNVSNWIRMSATGRYSESEDAA